MGRKGKEERREKMKKIMWKKTKDEKLKYKVMKGSLIDGRDGGDAGGEKGGGGDRRGSRGGGRWRGGKVGERREGRRGRGEAK